MEERGGVRGEAADAMTERGKSPKHTRSVTFPHPPLEGGRRRRIPL